MYQQYVKENLPWEKAFLSVSAKATVYGYILIFVQLLWEKKCGQQLKYIKKEKEEENK